MTCTVEVFVLTCPGRYPVKKDGIRLAEDIEPTTCHLNAAEPRRAEQLSRHRITRGRRI